MPAVKNAATALLVLTGMSGPLIAAPTCATNDDMAAFRTAAVQQQLMVAALTCHDVDAYNRFVIAYRPELQKSDSDLKSYFIRQGSEAAYDTFKTKLANLSSLSDIANGPAYCANAGAAFDIALRSRQSLASFVADERLMIALPKQTMCETRPVEAVADKPAPVKVAAMRTTAPTVARDVSVYGVPSHELPASPYGNAVGEEARQMQYDRARQDADREDADRADANREGAGPRDADDEEFLPPPPRPEWPGTTQALRDEEYNSENYASDSPPRWWPRSYRHRWYQMPDDEQ